MNLHAMVQGLPSDSQGLGLVTRILDAHCSTGQRTGPAGKTATAMAIATTVRFLLMLKRQRRKRRLTAIMITLGGAQMVSGSVSPLSEPCTLLKGLDDAKTSL